MRIQSSNVLLTSQHVAVKEQTKSESLKVWLGNRRPNFENIAVRFTVQGQDMVDLSHLAKSAIHDTVKGRAATGARERGDIIIFVACPPASLSVLTRTSTDMDGNLSYIPRMSSAYPSIYLDILLVCNLLPFHIVVT